MMKTLLKRTMKSDEEAKASSGRNVRRRVDPESAGSLVSAGYANKVETDMQTSDTMLEGSSMDLLAQVAEANRPSSLMGGGDDNNNSDNDKTKLDALLSVAAAGERISDLGQQCRSSRHFELSR